MSFRPKVLLSLLTDQEEYQRMQAEAAQSAATREGLELEVVYAEKNPVLQIQQIHRAVARPTESRPSAIVVHSVGVTGVEGAARAAMQAKIGWMLLSEKVPYLEALRREFPGPLVGCVYVDNEEVGKIQGRIAKALLPAGGSIVCVEGPSMSGAAQNRRKGLERELSGTQLKVSRWISGDWTAASAERVMGSWVRNAPDSARPSLILCQNDEMGAGTAEAIQRIRPDWADVPIAGCDGVPERGQKMVRENVLAATIVIPPRADIAIEVVAKHLRKQPAPFATLVTPQVVPSTRELAALGTRLAERGSKIATPVAP
jgi:ABC-type sugar transport system substrate-binding protein